jgi:hypothetical protein
VSSRARALPGSREQAAANAAAEVREAHRVARRDAAAVRAGGTVKSRFVDSDPIDPRSVAASADRSYREIVEDDKREAAARVRAAARESWLGASSESDPVAFDASGRVTKTKTKTKTRAASLGDARDYVAAEADEPETPETPETARDDASDLTGSEIVVDATTLGLGEDLDAGDASGLLDAVAGSALARLGDAPLDPTDPDSEDYVAQMGSSPEDTRKLWAQFKAHLAKFEEAKDARARASPSGGVRAFSEEIRDAEEDVHDARVSAAAAEKTRELVEASLGARETAARRRGVGESSAVLRVLGGAAVLATAGVFGMSKLATRLRLEHAAALGSKEERLRLLVPDPENFRGATPLAPRESPKTTTATWQKAAAARWRSHFGDSLSDDSVVDV